MRAVARRAALTVLAAAGAATGRTAEALTRPRVHFVYLHHVLASEVERFDALLTDLQRDHALIGYSEAVERVTSGGIDRPYAAFSFDDGLKSCVTAARVLEAHGVTGCFFVCPSIPAERDPDRVARFCRERLRMPPLEFMDWDEIEGLKAAGHEIGSHTLSHSELALAGPDELDEEVAGSRALLRERLGDVDHFSWPFGRFEHFGPGPARVTRAAGYASCASAVRGSHVGPEEWPCIRRDHVIAEWPRRHTRWLLAASARRAVPAGASWPAEWDLAASAPAP